MLLRVFYYRESSLSTRTKLKKKKRFPSTTPRALLFPNHQQRKRRLLCTQKEVCQVSERAGKGTSPSPQAESAGARPRTGTERLRGGAGRLTEPNSTTPRGTSVPAWRLTLAGPWEQPGQGRARDALAVRALPELPGELRRDPRARSPSPSGAEKGGSPRRRRDARPPLP